MKILPLCKLKFVLLLLLFVSNGCMNFANELSGNFINVSFVVEIFIVPPMSKSIMLVQFEICLEISLFFSQRFFSFSIFASSFSRKSKKFVISLFIFSLSAFNLFLLIIILLIYFTFLLLRNMLIPRKFHLNSFQNFLLNSHFLTCHLENCC